MERVSHPGLQIDEDLEFQEKLWRFERAAWVIMFMLIIAALAGLFGGSGVLSHVRRAAPGIEAEVQQFGRLNAPFTLTVAVVPKDPGRASLWISQEYLKKVEIEQMVPTPVRADADASRVTYHFEVPKAEGLVPIRFYLRTKKLGLAKVALGVPGVGQVEHWQLIYP